MHNQPKVNSKDNDMIQGVTDFCDDTPRRRQEASGPSTTGGRRGAIGIEIGKTTESETSERSRDRTLTIYGGARTESHSESNSHMQGVDEMA